MTTINMFGPAGEPLGRLRAVATDLIEEAERTALDRNMSKRLCLPVVLREHVEQAGYIVTDLEITRAASQLEAVRHGETLAVIEISIQSVAANQPPAEAICGAEEDKPMPTRKPQSGAIQFFELEQEYPNEEAKAWYERLVGLDDHKHRLLVELELMLYPERVEAWSRKHHKTVIRLCGLLRQRVPLVLLEGDVGCGKTALAETIGDALARRTGGKIHLLKINTQVRGSGHVGEMTDLIVQAFAQAEQRLDSLKGQPVLLLIDEADALAAKRSRSAHAS
jgi:SpoVK/Ycf46/Vps4 family AAA+-type ATPase